MKLQPKFKREANNVFTEKVSKIAESTSDDKKMQTCDGLHLVSICHRHWKSVQSKANRTHNNEKLNTMINFDVAKEEDR